MELCTARKGRSNPMRARVGVSVGVRIGVMVGVRVGVAQSKNGRSNPTKPRGGGGERELSA